MDARQHRCVYGVHGLTLLAGLCLLLSVPPSRAADHPTLIQAKQEMCETCHEDLVKGHDFGHAPVAEDCTVCHDVNKGDDGTEITLSDAEPQLCLMCHGDLEDAVNGELASPHMAVMMSCLDCHNAHGGQHAALLNEEPRLVCATCHDPADLAASHKDQITDATECLSCHLPHGSPNESMLIAAKTHAPFTDGSCEGCHRKPFGDRIRLRNRGEKLCTACHGSFDVPEGGVAHEAMTGTRARAGCLNCHDPHMSDYPSLVKSGGTELCSECHQDVAFLTSQENVHFPAEEDCANCHTPHVSERARLLTEEPLELCSMCHDTGDEELVGKHLGADLTALDCNTCHNPHGSEHGKLLARNVHYPVLDGCDTCHEGGHDELMDDGESSLCLMCHEDIGETAEAAQVPHGAMELARCVDCHNAHASPNELLVSRSGAQVCTDCHDDQSPGEGEEAHGAIERFGCQACHLPHGGAETAMLRVPGDDLCLGCHGMKTVDIAEDGADTVLLDRFAVGKDVATAMASVLLEQNDTFGHPTPGHLVRGTTSGEKTRARNVESTYEGEIGCLTCHDPHKGTGGTLFRWNAAARSDVCTHCHAK